MIYGNAHVRSGRAQCNSERLSFLTSDVGLMLEIVFLLSSPWGRFLFPDWQAYTPLVHLHFSCSGWWLPNPTNIQGRPVPATELVCSMSQLTPNSNCWQTPHVWVIIHGAILKCYGVLLRATALLKQQDSELQWQKGNRILLFSCVIVPTLTWTARGGGLLCSRVIQRSKLLPPFDPAIPPGVLFIRMVKARLQINPCCSSWNGGKCPGKLACCLN